MKHDRAARYNYRGSLRICIARNALANRHMIPVQV